MLSLPYVSKPKPRIYDKIREQRKDFKNVTFLNDLSFDDAVAKIKSAEV